jgi:ABC-type glycerol-3-phosphate transport system substrate-binding protein
MKLSLRLLLSLLVAFVLAVAIAGCGGDGGSKDEYEAGLAKVQSQLAAANEASQQLAVDAEPDERKAALSKSHESISAAADTAAKLDPPSDVAKAHDKLATALRDYADLFGQLATLDDGDPKVSVLYGDAGAIVERLDDANRAIEKAGYTVPKQKNSGGS